jgi:hypothetical protein
MKCWRPVIGILACGMALAPLSPAAANVTATTIHAGPAGNPADISYAQRLASAKSMVGGDTIAKFFLSLATDPAKNFIMDQIGLETTSSKIRDLAAKLNEIQQQLTDFQVQITALIAQLGLTGEVNLANQAVEGLATFYRDHFATIGTDLVNLTEAQAKVPPDKHAVDVATDQYNSDKKTFIDTANTQALNARIGRVEKVFEPGAGATGLMRAVGESILSKNEYLTLADSEKERAVYVYYEENQALAAWLTCEWQIARGHAELVPAVVKEFTDAVDVQRNPNTRNGLPPLLPRFAMLDRGTNPGEILDSRNKLMFTDTRVGSAIWTPTGIGDLQVPNLVRAYNAISWEGFSDWGVPDQREVYGLFNKLAPPRNSERISDYLSTLNLNVSGIGPFIWTRDAAHRTIDFRSGGFADFAFFEGISTRDLSADERPRVCSDPICHFRDRAVLLALYDEARGHLFLVRNVGDTRYF